MTNKPESNMEATSRLSNHTKTDKSVRNKFNFYFENKLMLDYKIKARNKVVEQSFSVSPVSELCLHIHILHDEKN